MLKELDVKPGDKVANYWTYYGGSKDGDITDIFTVINVTEKGNIIVGKGNGERLQFDASGYRKGKASGRIRKLQEGEEEAFIVKTKAEWAKVKAKKDQDRLEREKEVQICYQWALDNAWPTQSIVAVNCTIYIVSLPIPNEPCTLVMRFDKTTYDGEYAYNVTIFISHTRETYLTSGTTNTHTEKIDPLEVAAMWIQSWVKLENLKEKEDVGQGES